MTASRNPAAPTDVFALDLDGVLVDSVNEICEVGCRAAKASLPDGVNFSEENRAEVLSKLLEAFPMGTQGSDQVVLARILMEDLSSFGGIVKKLSDWGAVKKSKLEEWGVTIESLQEAFMAERKSWRETDNPGWAQANAPFPGIKESLMYCEFPFYIVTAKPGSGAAPVLTTALNLPIPEDSPRLFAGLDNTPGVQKAEALREIASRPMCKEGARLHYVDDRFATLKELRPQASLKNWNLYLADWGYNTEDDQAEAKKMGINCLTLREFCEMLKWGLVMGVDDGCEPTAEEVEAQVYSPKE
ncbi:hypothetical protein BSKO_07153 [Bryopsis sp. KO-2023]|nr:hypothetical protein BSKO_07153 [Bryopsis sp. KO-2023]